MWYCENHSRRPYRRNIMGRYIEKEQTDPSYKLCETLKMAEEFLDACERCGLHAWVDPDNRLVIWYE